MAGRVLLKLRGFHLEPVEWGVVGAQGKEITEGSPRPNGTVSQGFNVDSCVTLSHSQEFSI